MGGDEIRFLIQRKRMKNLRIRVCADGSVSVSAPPHISQSRICAFVADNADGILKRQRQIEAQRRKSYPAVYQTGDTFCFAGRRMELVVENGERQSAKVRGNALVLRVPAGRDAREAFAQWMIRAAREAFSERLLAVKKNFEAEGMKLSVRRMLTRWGSINTRSRSISLTVHLARCEIELIDYVITHELCHLGCPRHNQKFYHALEQHYPNRREMDRRLAAYGLVDF